MPVSPESTFRGCEGAAGIVWASNTRPAASATAALSEGGDRIVFRGRLGLTDDGAAVLHVGGALIRFDLAEPLPPQEADGSRVEVHVARGVVGVWPYQL